MEGSEIFGGCAFSDYQKKVMMKAFIHYVASHRGSCRQARKALATSVKRGWNAELKSGITPETLNESDFPFADLGGGRLEAIRINDPQIYPYKKSNLFNMLSLAKRVVEYNEPMVFLEHDALCKVNFADFDFDEYCFLAFDSVGKSNKVIRKYYFKRQNYTLPKLQSGVNEFPQDYPVYYHHESIYKGAIMSPGTAALALSPVGAKKLLLAAEKHGLEQTDLIINSYNLRMQYLHPSPFGYQRTNLRLSSGFK